MSGAPININVFIDALGYAVAEPNGFLPELDAVRKPVRTVLGYSSGAVPTILTGVLPRRHGQWSFFYYAPESSPFRWMRPLGLLPHRVAANHRVRRPLSAAVARWLGYTGYFNLYAAPFDRIWQWDYCEKRDLFAPGGVNGHPTIFDALREAGKPFHCSDWRQPEEQNIAGAVLAVRDPEIEQTFVYLPGLDAWMHRHGKAGAPAALPRYEEAVRSIVASARGFHDEVRVTVFSDHGMANVSSAVDLQEVIDRTGLRYGRDYVGIYDSTMVRFWYLREGAEAQVRHALTETGVGHFLTDEELTQSGLDFPGHRYGEAIFLCDPGVLVVPSDMGLRPITGMHGYSEDHEDSDAVLLSSVPLAAPVRRIDDLNRLMRAQVGLPAAAFAESIEENA